jgi:hypothetical protein
MPGFVLSAPLLSQRTLDIFHTTYSRVQGLCLRAKARDLLLTRDMPTWGPIGPIEGPGDVHLNV